MDAATHDRPAVRPSVERGRRRLNIRAGLLLFALVTVIAFVAAFVGKFQGELLIGVAFAIVIVGDLIGAYRAFGDPSVDLELTGDGQVGTDLGAVVTARGSRQALWVRIGWWYPRWFTLSPGVPGWARMRPNARGEVRWLDVDLVARGPLGLWQVGRRDRIHLDRRVAVGPPPLEHAVEFPPLPVRPWGETVLTRGADDLTRGVREYRPGDPQRLVHWPATAHHGRLLVRETETLGITRLRVAVMVPMPGAAGEVAIGRAAWLVRDCLRRGWEVELLTTERVDALEPPPLSRSAFGATPTCSLMQDAAAHTGGFWGVPWPGAPAGYGAPMITGTPSGFGPPVGYGAQAGGRPVARTLVGEVRTVAELTDRLAAVSPGVLELPRDRVRTRIVAAGGDEWR